MARSGLAGMRAPTGWNFGRSSGEGSHRESRPFTSPEPDV
jgi:hypothetical protein